MNSMTLEFQVENQILSRTDNQRIVEDSVNYLYAHFTFSNDWNNTRKAIIVENKNVDLKYKVYLNDEDTCKIPNNIIDYDGFVITVIGENENSYVTITTSLLFMPVLKSNYVQAEESYVKYILSQTLNVYKDGDSYIIEIPDIYGVSLGSNEIDTVTLKNRNNEQIASVKLNFINDSERKSNQTYSSDKIENELAARDSAIQTNANNIQTNLNRLISDEARIEQNALDITGLKNTDRTHDTLIAGLRNDLTTEKNTRIADVLRLNNSILSKLNRLEFTMDSNFKLTLKAYDSNDVLLYNESIDLPSESAIVNIEFDETTNELIFTLQNGNTTRVPLGSIITGLATQTYVDGLNAQRIARENQIEGNLNQEIANRGTAETALQNQITANANDIALRVKYEDILDNLNSTAINKTLSANQGRVLKGLIDGIVNGTITVGNATNAVNATNDEDGNNIKQTYMNRTDAFALGMLDAYYDDNAGDIVFEYDTLAITDIIYDTTTGDIIFEY